MEMQPSGAGYPQQRKVRCGVGGGLLHERLLAIGFLDYFFMPILRQSISPYSIYIVYSRFRFLVAIKPGFATKRDKYWAHAKRRKYWARQAG